MTIGLNPTNTVKASQMPKIRERVRMAKALAGVTSDPATVTRQQKAAKAGGMKEKQRRRSQQAVAAAAKECPRRVLLTAALDGDKDARWTAQQLFGDGWRVMARKELGR